MELPEFIQSLQDERDEARARITQLETELSNVQPILGREQQEEIRRVTDENSALRTRITQLEQSLIFEIDDGMGSRVGLEGDPDLARLIEIMWPLHEVGGSIIGCAVQLIRQGQRDAVRVRKLGKENARLDAGWHEANGRALELGLERTKLQSLLTPRRIDEDTPDGMFIWINGSWEEAYRTDSSRWVQSSTNLYHDDQPKWWLPMLPAPEGDT